MLNINYSPLPYLFTSSLPTEIVITTEQPSVEITIECGRDTAFTTTLYPYNKQTVLYDIRSILEDYMLANALVHTPFMIFADDTQEYANTHQAEVIYCRVNLPNKSSLPPNLSTSPFGPSLAQSNTGIVASPLNTTSTKTQDE